MSVSVINRMVNMNNCMVLMRGQAARVTAPAAGTHCRGRGGHMVFEAESDTNRRCTSCASARPPTTVEGGSGSRRGTERWDMRRE